MTTHQLVKELLALPDVPVLMDLDVGDDVVKVGEVTLTSAANVAPSAKVPTVAVIMCAQGA